MTDFLAALNVDKDRTIMLDKTDRNVTVKPVTKPKDPTSLEVEFDPSGKKKRSDWVIASIIFIIFGVFVALSIWQSS
ncbi:MAG: hypothetical protein K2K84_05430 [Muribaculaceae bacterium]|nr:hypothetical protein [Muribaculaceae bacterium]